MKKILFYLSDHGFGHVARNIPIIEELLKCGYQVVVKTGVPQGEFVKDSLRKYQHLEVSFDSMDVGLILKSSSFEIDVELLEEKVRGFIESWPSRIQTEIEYLNEVKPKLVVCDIVPWVLCATKELGIKSCLISNFTWMEIYQEYLPSDIIERYQGFYQLADEILRYDLATPYMKEFFKDAKEISLCAREFNLTAVEKIKSQFKQPIVFVSVGRSVNLTQEIDVSHLSYQFIVTEGIQLVGDNVIYLPKGIENTQDYIMASEMVITKAGFGTVAETMLAQKKCAVIGRESVAEDRATVHHLVEKGLALKIQYEDGLDMEWILDNLERFEPSYNQSIFTNDAKKITHLLHHFSQAHTLIDLSAFGSEEMGYLVPLDTMQFPFEVKRVFYLVDVPTDAIRGKHAYYQSEQVLICLRGRVKIKCMINHHETIYELDNAKQGLYLAPHVWREAYAFSEDAILLAVSSEPFSETDYRRK